MRIIFNTVVSGKHSVYRKGRVYDLPTAEAEYWIGERFTDKEEPEQRPLVTPEVKATTRPIKKTVKR